MIVYSSALIMAVASSPVQCCSSNAALVHFLSECLRRGLNFSVSSRFKDTIVNAKYGGHTEAVRRLLGQLPISAQSYSSSPYLDLSLFSYDDKWVSVMERPKTCGDHPIRWARVHRTAGTLSFYTTQKQTNIKFGLLGTF